MAMKKVKLGAFFLGENEADNILETQQTGEEDGAAIDRKRDGEANHPIDIQLFGDSCDPNDRGKEYENMEPITPVNLKF